MGSRREEERNEKIIRGLMKLPPNRRCINCNILGPQYVCTNFWTFVCMTCSGIHREFTHRVKSVSMSKFTSEEVESLQAGGNQRAREVYLRSWDIQRQKLPDNSKVDKVREFIKSVYVDRKYSGGSLLKKPPRDAQSCQSPDNDTRRASSYHSYSQSPPYDFQYEDRVYGKQGSTLTRKPGSDRGIYAGKMSSFICSPTRLNEDKFANESTTSRLSDFSVSSGGDIIRSGRESPSIQKDSVTGSPVRKDFSYENRAVNLLTETKSKHGPQRTLSCGSIISTPSSTISTNEPDFGAKLPPVHGVDPNVRADDISNSSVKLFEASIPEIDLFQLPGAPTLPFVGATLPVVTVTDGHVPLKSAGAPASLDATTPSFFDHFSEGAAQQSGSQLNNEVSKSFDSGSDGWANFDIFQPAAFMKEPKTSATTVLTSVVFDSVLSQSNATQWPASIISASSESTFDAERQKQGLKNVFPPTDSHVWNAFDDISIPPLSIDAIQSGGLQSAPDDSLSGNEQILDMFSRENSVLGQQAFDKMPSVVAGGVPSYLNLPTENAVSDKISHKSTNPFDLPFDSELESQNMFLNMTSLHAALPNTQMQSSFSSSVNPQWFPVPDAASQGSVTYMGVQASPVQLGNAAGEGSAVSLGGNPFA